MWEHCIDKDKLNTFKKLDDFKKSQHKNMNWNVLFCFLITISMVLKLSLIILNILPFFIENWHFTAVKPFTKNYWIENTAWKESKYEVFSGPYFPVFGLMDDSNFIALRIDYADVAFTIYLNFLMKANVYVKKLLINWWWKKSRFSIRNF